MHKIAGKTPGLLSSIVQKDFNVNNGHFDPGGLREGLHCGKMAEGRLSASPRFMNAVEILLINCL